MSAPQVVAESTVDTGTALADRLVGLANASMQVMAVYLGDKLGWYRRLAPGEPLTPAELAADTRTDERYAREWLEHQAACGILDVHGLGTDEVRFSLPPGHAEVLTDERSLAFALPVATFAAGRGRQLDELLAAYRTGNGIGWHDMGDARESQAAANRPLFLGPLGEELLPSVPELHERLSRPGARIADVGCGYGWSAIGLARSYRGAVIDGVDVDEPSVLAARRNAEEAGVADRVRFTCGDAASLPREGTYDAVFAFECIHDLPDPVAVLATMRRLAGADGVVVVMDERVGEHFAGAADEVEQLMYGYSLTCCLPDGRAHEHSAATGTVMRPGTLQGYARAAGLPRFDVLPIDNDFFRFYRLA